MKVIYKETIVDKIQKLLHTEDKPIEKIILTQSEWEEFNRYTLPGERRYHPEGGWDIFGVQVEKEKITIPYILMAYSTHNEARLAFEDAGRHPLIQCANKRDMVVHFQGKKFKYASVGTIVDQDRLCSSSFDEIEFKFDILEKQAALLRFSLLRRD